MPRISRCSTAKPVLFAWHLYDLMATRLYPIDDRLAMYVDTIQRADRVTPERIVTEAAQWGIRRSRAEETVADVLDRLPDALAASANETAAVPAELVDFVTRRVDRLRSATPRARAGRPD